jgi:hypothetical protein
MNKPDYKQLLQWANEEISELEKLITKKDKVIKFLIGALTVTVATQLIFLVVLLWQR